MKPFFPVGAELAWDVIVVGAGPAGTSAALPLARAGRRVLILERRRKVGLPVQCAEYIPYALVGEVGAPVAAVAQRVDSLRTFIEGKLAAENHWPGAVLHRSLFDQHLAAQAVSAGAALWTGCRVQAVDGCAVSVRREGSVARLTARVIVGADGPVSISARSAGCPHEDFVYGLQVEAPLQTRLDHTEVHFRPEFLGGYAWVFPKETSANVGVGVTGSAANSLPRLLHAFLADLRAGGVVMEGPTRKRTGGMIPVGGPPARTAFEHLLLAGDAAGQTDPITGSGIPAAVHCGQLAGQAICRALAANDPGRIREYEEEWREDLSRSLGRALERRRTQCSEWNQGSFEQLIQRTWIAFPEYYRAE